MALSNQNVRAACSKDKLESKSNVSNAEWGGGGGGGVTLGISGWGCAAGTLEPLTYTRASSAEFCYPMLESTPQIPPTLE